MGSIKAKLGADFQIMRMKTPEKYPFGAILTDIPDGIKLEDIGPISYVSWLDSIGGSNIRVILNKEIKLNCGTKAYRTDFIWLWKNGKPMTTSLVSSYKDGKAISLFVHTWQNLEQVVPIVQSLTFR